MRKAISKQVREVVKMKYGGRCAYCGDKPDRLQIDHLNPVAYGGTDSIENLMPACFSCNNFKNVFSLENFRRDLESQIHKARRYSVNFRLAERFGLLTAHEQKIVFYFEKEAAK